MVGERSKQLLVRFDEMLSSVSLTGDEFTKKAKEGLHNVNHGRYVAQIFGHGCGADGDLRIDAVLALELGDCVIRIEVFNPWPGEICWDNIWLEAVLDSGTVLQQERSWDDLSFLSRRGEEYMSTCIPFKRITQILKAANGEVHTIRRVT